MMDKIIGKIIFNENGLVPTIAQQYDNKEVLMMAWMNEESIKKTVATGMVHYWSRSRNKLWMKGETSGNFQKLKESCNKSTRESVVGNGMIFKLLLFFSSCVFCYL